MNGLYVIKEIKCKEKKENIEKQLFCLKRPKISPLY